MNASLVILFAASAAVSAAAHLQPQLPAGRMGKDVSRLTLLPGPTLLAPARGAPSLLPVQDAVPASASALPTSPGAATPRLLPSPQLRLSPDASAAPLRFQEQLPPTRPGPLLSPAKRKD